MAACCDETDAMMSPMPQFSAMCINVFFTAVFSESSHAATNVNVERKSACCCSLLRATGAVAERLGATQIAHKQASTVVCYTDTAATPANRTAR